MVEKTFDSVANVKYSTIIPIKIEIKDKSVIPTYFAKKNFEIP
jgi:hypothetical protein